MAKEKVRRIRHYVIKRGKVFARYVYTDASGKRRQMLRLAESKTNAKDVYDQLKREHQDHGDQILDASKMTFSQLASIYQERRLQPAEYVSDRKVSGRRSYYSPQLYLKVLVEHFGRHRIRSITHSDIEQFKLLRLKTPTRSGEQRSIADVHRTLEVMRAALHFAVRSGWLIRSPFETGAPLISKADETERDRVLSRDEEGRLLAACVGRRAHLRAIIITALDTGMRRGEILTLTWPDIDLLSRRITIKATNTKTQRERVVPITARLLAELEALYAKATNSDTLVFGITTDIKKAFATACRDAGIEDFRLHDCRHTAITRWIEAGMPPMQVMKISGHTQMQTFKKYINVNDDALDRAAAVLDAFHAKSLSENLKTRSK